MEIISIEYKDNLADGNELFEETKIVKPINKTKTSLSGINLSIQDYLEYKAARCIQRFVRGWLYRTKHKRKRLATIKIQSEWRRFYCQRLYFRKYEDFLQKQIEKHFYRAAQILQALWRGWWVRHHIHDHTRLMRLQHLAGKDLLYCVAFKLHHLLRTHHIPGVYSLKDSGTFSKVEQLLASLKFKTYNQCSIRSRTKNRRDLEKIRKQHEKSACGIKVPFVCPVINKMCVFKCAPLYNAKDAHLRMDKILQEHEESREPISSQKISACSQRFTSPTVTAFCHDIINSMRKWNTMAENNQNALNFENFFKELESKTSILKCNWYCRREFLEEFSLSKT